MTLRHTIAGRQPNCRWAGVLGQAMSGDQSYLLLWKILEMLALCCLCLSSLPLSHFQQCKKKSYDIPDYECCLWYLSRGAPAEFQHIKWSKEIKLHWPARTWFPLSPPQLLGTLHTLQELMDYMVEVHIIYYPNTQCFCSPCLHCSRLGVQIFPRAQFHPLFWRNL